MGTASQLSFERSLVVTRENGEVIECGDDTVRAAVGELLYVNLTDPTDATYCEHVFEISGEGSSFSTEGIYSLD